CPDLNLIHYIEAWSGGHPVCHHVNKGRLKNGLAKSAVYGSETRCTRFQTTLWQNERFILPLCCCR
ncbi:hypothetical protein OJ918_10955, partial [Streptococcus anginosus]|nr:hypothetical protein [Streptococcus anginosus]